MAPASQTYTASDLDALTARLSALISTFNSTERALQQGPGMAVVHCVEDVGAALVWLVRGYVRSVTVCSCQPMCVLGWVKATTNHESEMGSRRRRIA